MGISARVCVHVCLRVCACVCAWQYVLPKWELSKQFVHKCRKGVFQYVFIKVALTIITLILVEEDKYMNGDLSPKCVPLSLTGACLLLPLLLFWCFLNLLKCSARLGARWCQCGAVL
jgi:hypothetical protein